MNDTLYQWFVDDPARYWVVALPFGVLAGVAAFQVRRIPGWGFLAALALCLVVFRWPALVGAAEASADESQIIAGAITLRVKPVFWRDVDVHATGPLAVYPLTLLGLLGAPLNFATARCLGLFLDWVCLIAGYRLLREYFGEGWARVGVLPASAFVALCHHGDLAHYSSETVAMALVMVGLAATWIGLRGSSPRLLLGGGLALGASAWAKVQGVPVAAAIGLAALAAIAGGVEARALRWRRAGLLIGGGILGAAGPLLLIAGAGAWSDWADSYIRASAEYVGRPAGGRAQVVGQFLADLHTGVREYAVPLAIVVVAALAPALRRAGREERWLIGGLFAGALGALAAILAPGRYFPHYFILLVAPLTVAAAACAAAAFPGEPASGPAPRRRMLPMAAFLFVTVVPQLAFVFSSRAYAFDMPPGMNHLVVTAPARLLLQHARAGDTLCVWGWQPDLHVMTGLPQATREAHTERQIEGRPLRPFYRERFLAEFERSPPRFFVDAIVPWNFAFNDRRRHGFSLWPELGRLIAVDYILLAEADGYRIYERIDRGSAR